MLEHQTVNYSWFPQGDWLKCADNPFEPLTQGWVIFCLYLLFI